MQSDQSDESTNEPETHKASDMIAFDLAVHISDYEVCIKESLERPLLACLPNLGAIRLNKMQSNQSYNTK